MLFRYLFFELLRPVCVITLVFLAIFAGNALTQALSAVVDGQLSAEFVLSYFLVLCLETLIALIPLGVYLGIVYGLGRLYQDNEMIVLASSGASAKTILKPVLCLGLLGTLILFPCTVVFTPWARMQQKVALQDIALPQRLAQVKPGELLQLDSGKTLFFATDIAADGTMHQVFLHRDDALEGEFILRAAQLKYQQDGQGVRMSFYEGERVNLRLDGSTYVIRFERHDIYIAPKPLTVQQKISAYSTKQLMQSDRLVDRAELYWRIAVPFSALLLAYIAWTMSYTPTRAGRYGNMLVAFFVYLLYVNCLELAGHWATTGALPAWASVWCVQGAFFIFSAVLYKIRRVPF